MSFPVHRLAVKEGSIYCHIHENKLTGLKRGLFWSITLEFEPLEHAGEEFAPSMTIDWISWPVRSWRQLGGQSLETRLPDPDPEASFYLSGHEPGRPTRLTIEHEAGCRFRVNMGMVVDFHGFDEGDRDPAMVLEAEAVIPFTELIVVPGNLAPPPRSSQDVSRVAADFVDLADFASPVEDRFRFRLHPLDGLACRRIAESK